MGTRAALVGLTWIKYAIITNMRCIFTLLLILESKGFCAVQILEVKVPDLVKAGETVELSCRFDLEEKSLYSLNWWKGNDQFYQYSPAGGIHQTIYDLPGILVDRSRSSFKTVVLRNVSRATSGPFKCEVVADFPSYERDSLSSHMEVVEVPISQPEITMWRIQFEVGDRLRANCTTPGSIPPPTIVWFLNGKKVLKRFTTDTSPRKEYYRRKLYNKTADVLRPPPISSHVSLELKEDHFINGGRAVLTCHTLIPNLYHSSTEVQITLPGVSPVAPSQRVSSSNPIYSPILVKLWTLLCSITTIDLLSHLWPQMVFPRCL